MPWKSKAASPVTKHSRAGRGVPGAAPGPDSARPPQFRGPRPAGERPGSPRRRREARGRRRREGPRGRDRRQPGGPGAAPRSPGGARARRPLTWCVLLASLETKSRTRPQSWSSSSALRRQRPPRGTGPPGAAARSPQLTPTGPDQRDSGAAGGGGASSRSWPRVAGGSSCSRRRRRRPRPWGQCERPSAAPRGRSIAAECRRRRHLPPGAPAHPRRRRATPPSRSPALLGYAQPGLSAPIGWPPVLLPRPTPHWLASPPASGVLDSDAKMRD